MGAHASEVEEFDLEVPPGRLDLGQCLNSGQVFRWRKSDGSWIGVDGEAWYQISEGATLRVRSNASPEALSRFLRLDWDAEAVERECLRLAPELAPYLVAQPGLRLLRPSSATEVFYTFLCTPNNHIARIATMVQTLASFGEPVGDPSTVAGYRFPESSVIASIPESVLRGAGFGYRAATIPAAARHVMDLGGDPWIESLRHESYETAFSQLNSIRGIGPKLADCICLFGLDHTEAVPVDTHIWQAATRLYFPEWQDKPVTESRYRAVGDAFRDRFGYLAGWVQQHLFLDNVRNWRARKDK